MNDLPEQVDGTRWLVLDENTQYGYIAGFLEGMFLGYCFTTWEMPGGQDDNKAWQSAVDSYDKHYNRFVAKTTYRQFYDGLNKLYSDQDNLKIGIRNGMWIVMNEIVGKPDHIMKPMIHAFRVKAIEEIPTYNAATFPAPKWEN